MPPKRVQKVVDDEYQESGQPARKKRASKDIHHNSAQIQSEGTISSEPISKDVIDVDSDTDREEDPFVKIFTQKSRQSVQKLAVNTASKSTTKVNQNTANPPKNAAPRRSRKKQAQGRIVVKELPPQITPSGFPRFSDGFVYIIVHQSDHSFQYRLHADALSCASPILKVALGVKLQELDEKIKVNGTKKCADGPATKGTHAKARFDLVYSPELNRWVLERTIFTAFLPPPKLKEEEHGLVDSKPARMTTPTSSSGERPSTDDAECSIVKSIPYSDLQTHFAETFPEEAKNATRGIKSLEDFIAENNCKARGKAHETQSASVSYLPRPSSDSYIEAKAVTLNNGQDLEEEITVEEKIIDTQKLSTDLYNEAGLATTGVSRNMDDDITVEKSLSDDVGVENKSEPAAVVEKVQRAGVFDPREPSSDSCDDVDIPMTDVSQTVEEEIAVHQNQSTAVLESHNDQVQPHNSMDPTKLKLDTNQTEADFSHAKRETEFRQSNDTTLNEAHIVNFFGSNQKTNLAGSKIWDNTCFSNTCSKESPSAASLHTDGPGHYQPTEANNEAIHRKLSYSIQADSDDEPKSPPMHICRAYNRLFLIICNLSPQFYSKDIAIAIGQYETLAAIASELECVDLVGPHIAASSLNYGMDLGKAIKYEPARWLKLSTTLKIRRIFREAMVHIVGMQPEWPWEEPSIEEFSVKVQNLIRSKAEILSAMKLDLNKQLSYGSVALSGVPISIFSLDPENVGTWVVTRIWRDWFMSNIACFLNDTRPYSPLISPVYRALAAGGDAYLSQDEVSRLLKTIVGTEFRDWEGVYEDLSIMKEFAREQVRKICKNKTMLDVDEENIKYLTCTEISDSELPWPKTNH